MRDSSKLPDWPRAMRQELAAAYCGLSSTTFRQVVAPAVPPIQLSPGRIAWLRERLDAWLDSKAGGPSGRQEPNPWDAVLESREGFELGARDRLALEHMARSPHPFEVRLWMPDGVGDKTLDSLVSRGLMTKGPCAHRRGQMGWGLTEAGRRAAMNR